MASLHSFYITPEQWQTPFTLTGSEAHHLSRVLRIKQGASVRLFDGAGRHGLFTVQQIHKHHVELSLESEEKTPRPVPACTLAAGYSKALRRSWFLEKAVELEASSIWFWQAERSQAQMPENEKHTWQASLVAGAKQCENPWLPELFTISGGAVALAERCAEFDSCLILYEGDTHGHVITQQMLRTGNNILLIVGPEGGFSHQEASILQDAGCKTISLGNRVLRWETAAVVALGLAWWARQ